MTDVRGSDGVPASTDIFLTELRQLRVRSGQPSFRRLSQIAEQRIAESSPESRPEPLPPSTVSEVLAGKRLPGLPRWGFVESYVAACLRAGGADEPAVAAELARWRERWCELAVEDEPAEAQPGRRPGPRWRLVTAMAGVFLLGVGSGVVGVARWVAPSAPIVVAGPEVATASDQCVASARPVGRDLLGSRDWRLNNSGLGVLSGRGGQVEVTVPGGTNDPADVLLIADKVDIVKGDAYALAFTTVADRKATIRVRVQDNGPPEFTHSLFRTLEVGPEPCRRVYRFSGALTNPQSELTYQLGGLAEDLGLRVTDIVLVRE